MRNFKSLFSADKDETPFDPYMTSEALKDTKQILDKLN